jgi:uncharacterized protein (DUF2249 family)
MDVAKGAIPSPVPPAGEPSYRDSRGQSPTTFDVATRTLDVRADLENGHEPLGRILDALAALEPTEDLVVESTFHPVPLRRLLSGRGFASFAEMLDDQYWRVRFRRESAIRDAEATASSCCGGRCGSRRA